MIELKRLNKTLKLRNSLFWDIDIRTLDNLFSKKIIVERVITRGNLDEFIQLNKFYSKNELKETIIKIGYLDPRTLNFVSGFFDLPVSNFLCYKKKLLNPAYWNS